MTNSHTLIQSLLPLENKNVVNGLIQLSVYIVLPELQFSSGVKSHY